MNNFSSYISATRLSHFFLCFDLCFFLHAALQYFTKSHLLHEFILSPSPSLPHAAHTAAVLIILLSFASFSPPLRSFLSPIFRLRRHAAAASESSALLLSLDSSPLSSSAAAAAAAEIGSSSALGLAYSMSVIVPSLLCMLLLDVDDRIRCL